MIWQVSVSPELPTKLFPLLTNIGVAFLNAFCLTRANTNELACSDALLLDFGNGIRPFMASMNLQQQNLFDLKSKWDVSVPIEKSAYVQEGHLIYYNLDSIKIDPEKLNMIDLFCGAGGFSVGCSWAGFQSVFGVDYLEPAMKTWVKNHPHAMACLGDIKKLSAKELRQKLAERGIEKIHLMTGGVPCQGFSRSNRKHRDDDERNFLFLEYMRFVEEFLPDYIILENVSGMRSTAGGHFEKEIKGKMDELGYSTSVKLLNAADYGVPQLRQRLLFVGVRRGVGLASRYEFPSGSFEGKHRTVADAISDLPPLENNGRANSYAQPPVSSYQRMMRGQGTIQGISPSSVLFNHVAPNHPPETVDKIAATVPGEPMYERFQQRIRLRNDAPSPTQLAGGIRPQFQFGHPTQPRGLSIRERARIQSFPDSYEFVGGTVQERVQTGNAVPPLLIYHLVTPIAADIRRRDSHV